MYYQGKDSVKEMIHIQKKQRDAFRLPELGHRLLYHYAGMETIWKILESDSFYARNVRFSNDSEEYRLGEEIIRGYAEEIFDPGQMEKFEESIQRGMQMFYMVCFCSDGDLLSQWRGYAKDGVSLGMDFFEENVEEDSFFQIFTVLNNMKNRSENKYRLADTGYMRFIEMPYQVFYVSKNGTDKRKRTEKALKKALACVADGDEQTDLLLNLIPFIKDEGFSEEAEFRLLFNMGDIGGTEAQNRKNMSGKIEYTEKENRKLPNIIVELGNGELKEKNVECVRLGSGVGRLAKELGQTEEEADLIYKAIQDELKKESITCICSEQISDIYIGEGKNQEDVMCQIEDILQRSGLSIEYEKGIKIWCKGHLPIREVIIGPGENKEKIRESLKYYMRNTYWLRYVDVKESKIPLQS